MEEKKSKPKTFVTLSRGPTGHLQVEQAKIDANGKLESTNVTFTDNNGHLVLEEFKTLCGRMIMGATTNE